MPSGELKDFVWLNASDGIVIEDHFESLEIKDESEIETISSYINDKFCKIVFCPDCRKTKLHKICLSRNHGDGYFTELVLSTCLNCGYWQYYEDGRVDSHALAQRTICAASHVRDFEDRLPEGPAAELAHHLRQSPERWHRLAPNEMELLVASVMKANHANCEVKHVGRSHDGGKDVIFIDDNKRQWLISCKCREEPIPSEPIDTLRCLIGTMVLENENLGIIASTRNRFSSIVKKDAKTYKTRGMQVELIDRGLLTRMLGGILDPRPWIKFVEYFAPDETTYFESLPPVNYGGYSIPKATIRRKRTKIV